MLKYICGRIGMTFTTLFVIITVTFFMMNLVPGGPFNREDKMPQEAKEALLRYYNLDKPLIVQYGLYLKSLVKLELGPSLFERGRTVNDIIKKGFPVSMRLAIQAIIIALFLGISLGILAALFHNRSVDYATMTLAVIGISVPSFIMATLFLQFIALKFPWVPIGGWGDFRHTLLPSLSLGFMPLAFIARLVRSGMLEVFSQDYIVTARSKGLGEVYIILVHAIKNAILPVVTYLGTLAANLLVGSFIIESIFGIPGLGYVFVQSIYNRDYTVIMGSTVFYSLILLTLLFAVDLLYLLIDPRIKFFKAKEGGS